MAFNPTWKAAQNGFTGSQEAGNHAAQINQLLGAHGITMVYPGNSILAGNPTGTGQHLNLTAPPPSYQDRSQPFVMPTGKTSIGRVTFPVNYVGNGSDLQVTLCPDSSGSPNLAAPICSTVIPASWGTNLTLQGSLTANVPPLVTAQYNAISLQNDFAFAWSQPAIGPGGAAQYAAITVGGNYMILAGGWTGSVVATTVTTVQSLGGGFIGNPSPQPAIPQGAYYMMMTATGSTVMVAGGTNGSAYYSNVWTASWDPNTGTLGAWTTQASLPAAVSQGCAASWGDYVYVTGGNTNGNASTASSSVYYANATNGQIQAWAATTPLPLGLQSHFAAAINGWLVVCGGQNTAGATQSATYYAKINTDGSLGGWHTGPTMPVGVYSLSPQWSFAFTEDAMVIFSGLTSPGIASNQCQTLPVMTNSIGQWWSQAAGTNGTFQVAGFPHGEPGNWQINILTNTGYYGADTLVVPMLSVPLPATGLTPGNTYHVVIHNCAEDLSDYTQFYVGPSANLSPYMFRVRYTNGAWAAQTNGYALPITIYDNTPGGNDPIHSWQDPNGTSTNLSNQAMAASTYVYDWYGRLLGYCEATSLPQDPLNQNTLTGTSTAPWTVTNGTLTTTAAQTHGGYANSGLLTPNGTSTQAYASSELISVKANTPYTAESWLYAATAITSNVSLSVNWFDASQTYISTSSNVQSLSAATWTFASNVFTSPAGAAYGAIVPTLSGTPSAGNPLYLSFATLMAADPSTLSSVAEVTYGANLWPPTGVSQLA